MPTTLVLRFPWGRYHATPGSRHVHEGAVDLPPSPWRLLRALYAVWRTRTPELDEDLVHGLLARLAVPPTFHVPRRGVARSRHPDMAHDPGAASVDRTLDAFAAFECGAELGARWACELDEKQRAALERLAGSIPYFGRADSVCEGFVPAEWEPDSHDTWVPLDVADSVDENAVVTSVLAPELPLRLDSLLPRPVDVRKGNLLFPVGTHLLAYQHAAQAPKPPPPPRAQSAQPTVVRFSVPQPELPPQTDSLIYTDLLRQGALSKLGRLPEERVLTQLGGRTADGAAMEGHGHAHYLPLITDRRLVGLAVWVPNGLPEDELKALTSVDRLYTPANPDWRLTIRRSTTSRTGGGGLVGGADAVAPSDLVPFRAPVDLRDSGRARPVRPRAAPSDPTRGVGRAGTRDYRSVLCPHRPAGAGGGGDLSGRSDGRGSTGHERAVATGSSVSPIRGRR